MGGKGVKISEKVSTYGPYWFLYPFIDNFRETTKAMAYLNYDADAYLSKRQAGTCWSSNEKNKCIFYLPVQLEPTR